MITKGQFSRGDRIQKPHARCGLQKRRREKREEDLGIRLITLQDKSGRSLGDEREKMSQTRHNQCLDLTLKLPTK